ncbi:hypothetical protein GCM10025768_10450 [Microbacterium pseudoresistens]|uniref:Glycosyltransferase involved in cell wall biosynthesis n=1 Tax=Microbacterium pseudoresistens TaxID=640634 RepID=A0A7Y9EW10_9MICO|nr:glycosyltransferase involved in cell wall biosynthesis [Microbacterium pseudoresistens]
MPESSARIGIVVRTKDRPALLSRAIDDILAQQYESWHAVIVDDAGDPKAVDAVIDALDAADRARFSVVHREVSTGRSAAANAGLDRLDTEFAILHDDDDLWHPAFLADAVAWLDAHPGDIGVVAPTEIVYERPEGDGFVEVSRVPFWAGMTSITYADLLQVNRFVPIAYLYRRAVHDEVGPYREDVHAAEDWEFNLRVSRRHPIGYLGGEVRAYWMQRRGVDGALGNSMFVLADDHEYYDRMIRDEALRTYVQEHGDGLVLYLARLVQDEVGRQLDERRTLGQRLAGAVREVRRRRRDGR